jgi:hypothetical protein
MPPVVELDTTALVPVEARDAATSLVGDVVDRAMTVEVIDAGTLARAGDLLLGVRDLKDRVKEVMRPWTDEAFRRHKAFTGFTNGFLTRLGDADFHLVCQIGGYRDRETARLKAEQAERDRVAMEAKANLDAAVLDVAEKAEAAGDAAGAAALIEQHTAPRLPVLGPTTPAISTPGLAVSVKYHAELVDMKALARAVADGAAPVELLALDTTFANAAARKRKKVGPLYPGVECVSEDGIRRTAGRGGMGSEDGM